jgi:hypothetical protein
MLKRYIAHPLILGLFFLSVAGPLSAQNDSKPIQGDLRVAPPATVDGGPGPWAPQCDGGPFDGGPWGGASYDQGPYAGPQGPWAYQGDSGWDYGDTTAYPPFFDSGCCHSGFGWGGGRFVVGVEGLIWRVNEDNLGFAERGHIQQKIVYGEKQQVAKSDPVGTVESTAAVSSDVDASKAISLAPTVGNADANFIEPPPGATILTSGRVKNEDFDFRYRPGFRLCAAYLFPCNCWDVGFQWTHFFNSASKSPRSRGSMMPTSYPQKSTEYSEEQLRPTFLPAAFTENQHVNRLDAHWRVRFNNFEISFGRYVCVGCGFGFHPYIAVKVLDIEQRLSLNSHREENVMSPMADHGHRGQKIKTEFQGVGFQGGFGADWCLGCGFSLYTNVSGGIVYGRAHVRDKFGSHMDYPNGTEQPGYLEHDISFRHSTHVSRPNLDLGIGVRWQTCLCNCYYLGLKAGWEYHHYFDQNFFRFVHNDSPGRGDLAFHGFTFGADVSF